MVLNLFEATKTYVNLMMFLIVRTKKFDTWNMNQCIMSARKNLQIDSVYETRIINMLYFSLLTCVVVYSFRKQ
jgi:hypothetical protein